MDSPPAPSFLHRWPLWLISGTWCCVLLLFLALPASNSLLQPQTRVEVVQPAGLEEWETCGLQVVDGGQYDQQWQTNIDAEVNELLTSPAFMTTSPGPALLKLAFDIATEIEGPLTGSSCPPAQFDEPPFHVPLPGSRGRLVSQSTGTSLTENAVAASLEWLAAHQRPDGGWSFAHQAENSFYNKCDDTCTHPGQLAECRTGATALALLPFLGAGQTHKQGKYKKQVLAALYLLTHHLRARTAAGVSVGILSEGGEQLHAQALSTLVLCEAYAMSQDKGLKEPAQYALNQLLLDPIELDDGWRWLALRSGKLAGLDVTTNGVPHESQLLAAALRDRKEYQGAAAQRRQKLIAVGGLNLLFNDVRRDDSTFKPAIELIDRWGPKTGDLDYRYFATQTLRHHDGELWTKWHTSLVATLITAQEKTGHGKGSWHFADDDAAAAGGRLYCTAMCAAILEVYYRHQPIYGKLPAE
jgi:hypothetical protein